jgi:Family of unknown function (DUF5906)
MTQAATNISSEDQGGAINPSGARQIVKPAKKEFRRINKVYVALEKAGLTDAILTIPPRTKIPAIYNPNGSHGPHYKWTTNVLTLQQVKRANLANAGAGIKGKFIGGLDYDGESVELAALIHGLAETYLGLSPIRGRPNSQRFLRPYRYKSDPIKRWSIKLRDKDGAEHTVEFIGDKCFWVAAGTHPSGFDYTYEGGIDLWKFGVGNLSQIDQADCDAFQAEIVREAIALGFELVSNKKSRSSSTRLSIDDPRHWAPTPELAIKALKARPNTAENNPSRDDLVRYIAAVKAALGKNREEYWPDVLDWALEYEGNTDDDVRKIWESVNESELGYWFLVAHAKAHGFDDDAEADFADALAPEHMPVEYTSKNPVEAMLARYVWCEALERYVDLATNTPISTKSFNTKNVRVSEFGNSGTKSAEAQFQNNPAARKVEIATYRPGQPVLIEDTNPGGVIVPAVNLWRPSLLVPARYVSDEDVSPWLQHVELLFGDPNGPAARHFLDFVAFLLQRPGVKINHAMVLLSEAHGIGKDTALDPIFKALGDQNVKIAPPEKLASQWTEYLLAQVVYVPEIMNFARREMGTKLKDFITTPPHFVSVNTKNVKQYDIPKIQNWIMSTNNPDALSIELTDRRYWVHECCLDEPRDRSYYRAIYKWFGDGGTEKVAGWLLKRDLSAFDPMAAPPNTEAKRRMLEYSQAPQVRWLRQGFAEGGAFATRTVMIAEDLLSRRGAAQDDDFYMPTNINYKHIATALKAEGFKKGPRIQIEGKARQLWARDPNGILSKLSNDQVRDKYLLEAARGGGRDATVRELSVRDEPSRKMAS